MKYQRIDGPTRARTPPGNWGRSTKLMLAAAALALGGLFGAPSPVAAANPPATDQQVADAITGGQQYLFNQFHDDGNGVGHWVDYNNLTGTSAAVAALVESGKMADPLYRAMIEKGIAFIKTQVKSDGGIYEERYSQTYETGMALVALGLYGRATTTDAAYRTIVQNAVNFLKSYQNIEGSVAGGDYGPNGEPTNTNPTTCPQFAQQGPGYAAQFYGGWSYETTTDKCNAEADLSNTQFAVMGLWYGSQFLGLATDVRAPWAKAVLAFLKNHQADNGAFFVYGPGDYEGMAATGGGLWSLALIGELESVDGRAMKSKALAWYDLNYTWNYSSAYMYAIYGMSKALTAAIGPAAPVGTHNWASDMRTEVVYSQYRKSVAANGADAAYDYWNSGSGLDPKSVAQTSWVLMSLAFASTSTESTQKLLAQEVLLDNIIRGLVTLHTTDGVTISAATRGDVGAANLGRNVELPIGSISFTLNHVPVGGTAVLSITPPAGALDPTLALRRRHA